MEKRTLKDLNFANQKVLVRVDYNVPMNDEGKITDNTRIKASLETVKYLLKNKAAVILMAHLGRPKGKVVEKYSLKPVAEELSKLLKKPVAFASDCVGEAAEKAAADLKPGQVLLLENLRFHPEEEANDPEFAKQLAVLADCYVNDGFGVSHRAHASVEGVTHYLPAVSGYLMEKEVKYLGGAVDKPVHPFAAIIGGAKVSDKIDVIDSLITKADAILIGGGMANTFLVAEGCDMGKSLVEEDSIEIAKKLLKKAKAKKVKMLLPVDLVMAAAFAPDAEHEVNDLKHINKEYMALDIGPKTAKLYADTIKGMKTVVWNGPMGVFEMDAFSAGTKAVADAVAACKGTTIVGGGDSAAAVNMWKLGPQISHVSTGGGASLEYLEGKVLPGVAALDDLRRPSIFGNWKCNIIDDVCELSCGIVHATEETIRETGKDVVLFPSFTLLDFVAEDVGDSAVGVGAQDLFYEDAGAYTGAVSGPMLSAVGCEYVLVGHSERRAIFGDTDAVVAKKVKAAFRNRLIPVLCVGENAEERKAKKTITKVVRQVATAMAGVDEKDAALLVVAYEPIWAIGSGKTPTAKDAEEVALAIREKIAKMYDGEVAARVRILYGGSVTAKNAHDFHTESIDGVLVGGASLKAKEFANIVKKF